ncbi:FAD-dependent oxidoreductase [Methylocystis parvus]|uniref:FAD-dependent oxidoreductase n=1 Tax=Methylocystis parvus TaxID=134 RepID=A0A6B8M3E4_9HYPH|nr:FAD-dependent oxidoreductase [Methylocystis parvus]QGM96838.1 FAD-dependent oxidoreductase [Methylocystis parvus]WBJ99283.1 FAD-dependent oxidoreductase [Methylocystis parvus OBBP]
MLARVIGAGVAGLCAAYALARAGAAVELVERAAAPGQGCSRYAGGMIAPWCELESAEPLVATLGQEALDFWTREVPVASVAGSLVVPAPRERAELSDFSRRTERFERLDGAGVARLEPGLAGRFDEALYFPQEAHLDPRAALQSLADRLAALPGVARHFGAEPGSLASVPDWTIDCRGFAARDAIPKLRGVKGEMLILRSEEISLSRPIRMLHPRRPVYVVPRGNGLFMVGATMIENEERARVTARSVVELVNSAFAIHPAFAEAEIVESGSDVRPAFPDNLPRLIQRGRTIYINGLYRHGFLLAPALARRAAEVVLGGAYFPEVMDAHSGERATA